MLPFLRIISVGGVSLAIAILLLALIPPGGSHLVLAQHERGARGAMMDPSKHPEWRQFLIHSALRRAGELERLRGLSDTIIRTPAAEVIAPAPQDETPAGPKTAGLSLKARDAEPEDTTGALGDNPGATLPMDIGEASSTELPVHAVEDGPPAIRLPDLQSPAENIPPPAPQRAAAVVEPKKPEPARRILHPRPRRKVATPAPQPVVVPPPFNILAAIFGSFAKADASSQTSPPAKSPVRPGQTAGNRTAAQ